MAKYYSEKIDWTVDDKYINTLDLDGFSSMISNPSYSYKFYWLEALVKLVCENKTELKFDEIIDEMIANAWYSVVEFHIHLSGQVEGTYRDGLEKAIVKLKEVSDLPSNASQIDIKNNIKKYEKELKPFKNQLTKMVPYRALSGFFGDEEIPVNWGSINLLVAYIKKVNSRKSLPYIIGTDSGLERKVYIDPLWQKVITDNAVQILGWIQYEKVKWLQNNNPEVPGIVYKLSQLDNSSRKLNQVRILWNKIMETHSINDVFCNKLIDPSHYDVDHFIPWSFVMNDELWNLMPMDSSLNSAKSNQLPIWDKFFKTFAHNQFIMYQEIYNSDKIHDLFRKCYRDNIHSIWAMDELYKKGNSKSEFINILEKNMRPVYDSAKRQGYKLWKI